MSDTVDSLVRKLLLMIEGSDPSLPLREGLRETPARVAAAVAHWFGGYQQDPAQVLKVFSDGAEGADQMVYQGNLPIWSHCEHHMAPIFGFAHIAYIPDGRVVGLSKLKRVADIFARRLQIQERLTNQIADCLQSELAPKGVGVVLVCRHACMESRGVCVQSTPTTTAALRGAILNEPETRAEFYAMVNSNRRDP